SSRSGSRRGAAEMRRPNISWPEWIDIRVVLAFIGLLIGIGLLLGAINAGKTNNKASSAKVQSGQAKKRSNVAVGGAIAVNQKVNRVITCVLDRKRTAAQRA